MTPRLHILRAGTHTDMHGRKFTFTASDLAAVAERYDPALQPAPVVIGHPTHNGPAFGWIKGLSATGNDLEADLDQLDPAFVEAVRAGRYRQRSASLYPPDHPANPKPGGWYLRHLGFLGAMAPAVKGLRGADLAEDDELVITFDCSTPNEESVMDEPASADLAELDIRAAALDAREKELAQREQILITKTAAMRRAEITAFCETLATDARIRPTDTAGLVGVIELLADAEPALAFAAGDDDAPRSPASWIRDWLKQLPPMVELSEVATKDRAAPEIKTDDRAVVAKARQLHADAIKAGAPISFAEAVAAAEGV